MPTFNGTSGNDTLNGTVEQDEINGLGGDDILNGGDGQDFIDGGDGDDVIHAGSGSDIFPDFIRDGAGNDTVYGEGDWDYIFGSPGNDYYDGGTGGLWQLGESDTVSYEEASHGIVVDMRLSSGQVRSAIDGDWASIGVDTIVNFESIVGSSTDDVMTAGNAYIKLFGGSGDDTLTGGNGGALLDGGEGNDTFFGGTGPATVSYRSASAGVRVSLAISDWQNTVGAGVDTLSGIENLEGSSHDDLLVGNDEANWIYGAGGNDILIGGAGDDELHGEFPGATTVYLSGTGNDLIYSNESGFDTIEFHAGDGQDRVYSIDAGDVVNIYGYSSALSVAQVGGDIVVKLSESDQITFRASQADLAGVQALLQFVNGTPGNDTLIGGPGDDTLDGGAGDDHISGNGGDDTLFGGDGNDTLAGGDGRDIIDGGAGNDTISGGAGQDLIYDGDGADHVAGNDGIDVIIASADGANDVYDGGTNVGGRDQVRYENALSGVVVDLTLAADQARSAGGGDAAGIGVDQLIGIETVTGSAFDDTLIASAAGTTLRGLEGSDVLTGGNGGDALIGDDGDDTLVGGGGLDSLEGGNGNDTIDGGSGTDWASFGGDTAVTVSLAIAGPQDTGLGTDTLIGIENLSGSWADDVLTGNAGNNTLLGGEGNDTLIGGDGSDYLNGGDGNDYLDGGLGDDTLVGGNGSDTYVALLGAGGASISETGTNGIDTLMTDANWGLPDGIENFTVIGETAAVTAAFGNELDNVMTGNDVENQFSGSTGNDTLYGAGGNDRLDGQEGNDFVYGQGGDDLIFGSFGNDYLDGGDGIDTLSFAQWGLAVNIDLSIAGPQDTLNYGTKTVTGFEILIGSQQADLLGGSAAADTISGGGGSDIIRGRGGNDTLTGGGWLAGGDGNDTLNLTVFGTYDAVEFHAGDDHDLVNNFNGTDQIHIYGYSSVQSIEQVGDAVVLTLSDTDSITFQQTNVQAVQGALRFITVAPDGTITGTPLSDSLLGDDGNNSIYGLGGADQIFGGNGDDLLSGGGADDLLNGGSGNDTLDGGDGQDTLYGGEGVDTASYAAATAGVQVSLTLWGSQNTIGAGSDTFADVIENLEGSQYNDVLAGNDIDNLITGGAGNDILRGYSGNDTLLGGDGSDTVQGYAGDDELQGGSGNDYLVGDGGNDFMAGGAGDDLYLVEGNDVIFEAENEGIDVVMVRDHYTLGANLENLTLLAPLVDPYAGATVGGSYPPPFADFQGTGNNLNNLISGNHGANILSGLGGLDMLSGGAGNDSFLDTAAGLNGDNIWDFSAGDKIVITDASLAGFSYSLSGGTLTYTGGTLTLPGFAGQLQASAAAGGGVELTVVPDVRNDFDGDGRSDLLLRHANGTIIDWLGQANGGFFSNHAAVTYALDNAWQVAGIGDFNGDGHDDLLLRHANGTITDWLGQANGGFFSNHAAATYGLDNAWQVAGTGDFNGDGFDDVLLRHDNGTVTDWLSQANGGFFSNHVAATYGLPAGWQVAGTGDFNGDGLDDVLLKHDNGAVTNWLGQANGGFFSNHAVASYSLPTGWQVAGIGDFDGDGSDDVLLRHANGTIGEWLGQANGTFFSNHAAATYGLDPAWGVASIGDFNGDGHDDLLLRHANGTITDWLGQANGTFFSNHAAATYGLDNAWQVQANSSGLGDWDY